MTSMKLLIIGLDGLDHVLVERWELSFYKQKYYGKHYVGFIKPLHTPIIWSCFLTGIDVSKSDYSFEKCIQNRSRNALNPLLRPLYNLRLKLVHRPIGIRKILIKLHLAKRYTPENMPERLLENTFIEELKARGFNVGVIEVPGYNEDRNAIYRPLVWKGVSIDLKEKEAFLEEIMKECERRVKTGMKYVDKGTDLVFVYLPMPDLAHHMLFRGLRERLRLYMVYKELVELIRPLMKSSEDYIKLIVSDHGFNIREYSHTDYGFWSLSIQPSPWWDVKTILDFKENIMKMFSGE